jgi:hypothetical protein
VGGIRVRIPSNVVELVQSTYTDNVRIGRWFGTQRSRFVAGCDHDRGSLCPSESDRVVDRIQKTHELDRMPTRIHAERKVDNSGSLFRCEPDTRGNLFGRPVSVLIEHAYWEDPRVGSDTGNSDTIVRERTDETGNVGAMPVLVQSTVLRTHPCSRRT